MDNYNAQDDFLNQFNKQNSNYKKPNVLICGYTGAGKSSILQALLGSEIVSADKISHGAPGTMDYDRYENENIVVYDSKGLEPDRGEEAFIENIKTFIREKQNDSNIDNHIHIFWYVIQAPGGRVTDTDLKIINAFPKASTIVILSKTDIARENQLESIKDTLKSAGISERIIIETTDLEAGAKGIEELYDKSLAILPSAYQEAFKDAQRINIEKAVQNIKDKKAKAVAIIATATAGAATAGATPIPVSDAAIITPIQITMIAGLAALYKLNKEQLQLQALPLIAQVVGMQTASSLSKLVPGLGSVISAATAGILTGGLGWFIQDQFEKMAISKVKGEEAKTINFDFGVFKTFLENYKPKK